MDQISGAYRSTSSSHARLSPLLARVTRSVTTWSSRIGSASFRVGAPGPRFACPVLPQGFAVTENGHSGAVGTVCAAVLEPIAAPRAAINPQYLLRCWASRSKRGGVLAHQLDWRLSRCESVACFSCCTVQQWTLGADSPLTAWTGGTMQVRILGPFQLEEGGRRITIGGVRQRAVLADLLLTRTRSCQASSFWWICGARTARPAQRTLFRRRSHDCEGAPAGPPHHQRAGLCAADLSRRAGRQAVRATDFRGPRCSRSGGRSTTLPRR